MILHADIAMRLQSLENRSPSVAILLVRYETVGVQLAQPKQSPLDRGGAFYPALGPIALLRGRLGRRAIYDVAPAGHAVAVSSEKTLVLGGGSARRSLHTA